MAGYMLVLNKLATEKTIFKVVKGHPKVSLKKMEKQTKAQDQMASQVNSIKHLEKS